MMPPKSESVASISKESGIPKVTLFGWKKQAKNKGIPIPNSNIKSERWSTQDKFSIVLETATLTEIELAEYCRSKGLYVQNLQEILNWKDTIQISCDDVFGEFSQRNMMSSQERQLIKNIRLLSKSSINYHVNITPTVYNQNKILDIVKQLIYLGVKKIGFTSYVPFGGKVSDMLKPNYSLLKNVEEEVTKLCKKNEITLSGELKGHPCEVDVNILKTIKKTYTVYSCEAGKYNIHINQKGEIYPCVFLEKDEFKIGTIYDSKLSIIDKLEKVRMKLQPKLNNKCIKCDYIEDCGAGCIGLIYDRYGNLDKLEYLEWTDKDLSEIVPEGVRQGVLTIPYYPNWPEIPCGYIKFSQAYTISAEKARKYGWEYDEFDAGHFHILVDPEAVTNSLINLIGLLYPQ